MEQKRMETVCWGNILTKTLNHYWSEKQYFLREINLFFQKITNKSTFWMKKSKILNKLGNVSFLAPHLVWLTEYDGEQIYFIKAQETK